MNICFLAYFPMIPHMGGVQRVTTILSKELAFRGHSVVYLFYDVEYKHQLNNPDIEFPQYFIDASQEDKEKLSADFHSFIHDHKIDLIINQTPDKKSCSLLSLVCREVKIISVCHTVPFSAHGLTRRDIWIHIPCRNLKLAFYKLIALICPDFYIHRAINKERQLFYSTLQCSDKLVFISNRFFKRVLQYMPDFPRQKLFAINNPNTFESSPNIGFEKKENTVLWVGRLDDNKNCMDFVKAWKLFSAVHTDWNAIVVGEGPKRRQCQQWAATHNVRRMEFVGRQKNVKKYYSGAKLFVSTSLRESWGMVVTEAMACGCVPVVYNTYETLIDIISDGDNGIACEPTPKALAQQLNMLVNDEKSIMKMSSNGIENNERFSVSVVCDQWIDLFQSMYKQQCN